MSILKVDTINEKTTGNGVIIPGHIVNYEKHFMSTSNIGTVSISAETAFCLVGATYTKKFSNSLIRVDGYYNMYRNGSSTYSRESIVFRHGVSNYFTSNSVISGYTNEIDQASASGNNLTEQTKQNGQVALYVQGSDTGDTAPYQNRFIFGTFKYDSPTVSIALAIGQANTQVIRADRYCMPTMHIMEIAQWVLS